MSLRDLFRVKTLEQLRASAEEPEHQLKKTLTTFDLTMFGIGAIIGAGIFSTIGTAAAGSPDRLGAGPALIISFILTALACGFTALCYAELACMIPVSGSAYTYAYATLGELMAWLIGWNLVLEYAVSNVAVAISWGDYFRSFVSQFGLKIPAWLGMDPRTALEVSGKYLEGHGLAVQPGVGERLALFAQARAGSLPGPETFPHWDALSAAPLISGFPVCFNLMAVIITVLITWLCFVGIKESARANSIMVVVKLVILAGVILIGAKFVNPGNWVPFAPNGFAGIQAGAAIIFFAFIGFDAVSTCAEECKDPAHDLPRGILYSLVICTVFYIAVTAVVTGMLRYDLLKGVADPLAVVFEKNNMNMMAMIISFGAIIATGAALLVYQVGQPRILMAMSRDGLLGRWFAKVHPKYGTPSNATLMTGVIVAAPAGLMNIGEVVELSNIGTLFAFAMACAAVLILRVKRPDEARRFRVPGVWFVGLAGIFSCVWLAAGLPLITHKRFVLWLIAGLVIYFIYGRRNSRLAAIASPTPPQPAPEHDKLEV